MRSALKTGAIALALSSPAAAQFTWPSCPDFRESEFGYVPVVTRTLDPSLREPVKMAFDRLSDGKVDIYFAERHGRIKRYSAAGNAVEVLGELDVYSDSPDKASATGPTEGGLGGIALDPDFRNNGWIYLYYEPWAYPEFRISRFTLSGSRLEPASEKVLLAIPAGRKIGSKEIVLPGGAMAFDRLGNLWIAVGANSALYPSINESNRAGSAEASSSDPSDWRGSILRIRPDSSAAGYSIPEGNFGEYWSAQFRDRGEAALADEYSDPAKVRPEVYVKGARNPYTLNVDPVRGWLAWGDYGPSWEGRSEEQNLVRHPVFAGYPYWLGRNQYILGDILSPVPDAEAPVNRSRWYGGPGRLPPAQDALYSYSPSKYPFGRHPATGPLYRYDGADSSAVKFPPHFDKAWFLTDREGRIRVLRLDEAGDRILDSLSFAPNRVFTRPLDFKQGPDGALYLLEYGTGWHATEGNVHIGRFEYTGSCRPEEPRLRLAPSRHGAGRVSGFLPVGRGPYVLRLLDMRGREIRSMRGKGPALLRLADLLDGRTGLHLIRLESRYAETYRLLGL